MIHFPFETSPRCCIGNNFALQELVILTAVFFRNLTFRPEPGQVVEPDPLITLRPKNGLRLRLTPRTA